MKLFFSFPFIVVIPRSFSTMKPIDILFCSSQKIVCLKRSIQLLPRPVFISHSINQIQIEEVYLFINST